MRFSFEQREYLIDKMHTVGVLFVRNKRLFSHIYTTTNDSIRFGKFKKIYIGIDKYYSHNKHILYLFVFLGQVLCVECK